MSLKVIRTLVTAAAAFLLLIGCGSEESTPDSEEPAARSAPTTRRGPQETNKIVEKMDPDGKARSVEPFVIRTRPCGEVPERRSGPSDRRLVKRYRRCWMRCRTMWRMSGGSLPQRSRTSDRRRLRRYRRYWMHWATLAR